MSKSQEFIARYPHRVREDVRLARYCTFKVGGLADLFVEADTPEELIEAVRLAHSLKINYFVLAGGSNVFFDDKGFRGVVIHYAAHGINIDQNKMTVRIEAGCLLSYLVKYLAQHNLGGMDFLANIPGSVGGAIVGNAGCYGNAIKNILVDVDIFNTKTGRITTVNPESLQFRYRHSKLKQMPHLIVLSARLKVIKDNPQKILRAVTNEKLLRLKKHPQAPCAGSFFKNPEGQAAWRLIEGAGMRGATCGGARVSNKHSNHLINYHQATAKDILRLADKVKKAVRMKRGIILEPEARFVDERGRIF